jgi:hypothetical protein
VSSDPEAYEGNRRVAAVNELLRLISLSSGSDTEWWNYHACLGIDGFTPLPGSVFGAGRVPPLGVAGA